MPPGVLKDVVDRLLQELLIPGRVARVAWLQAKDLGLGLDLQVVLYVLPLIHHLELVDALDVERGVLGQWPLCSCLRTMLPKLQPMMKLVIK